MSAALAIATVTPAATPVAPLTRAARSALHARRTFVGTMRGEWIKLLSLRSTWWVLGSTAGIMMLLALGVASSLKSLMADPVTAQAFRNANGAALVSSGFQLGMVTIAVLGALVITGEYSTGMIRSTFAAVPTRAPVLAAKAIALVALTTAAAAVGIALSYLVTMGTLSQYNLVPALDHAETWRIFAATAYCLIAAALFSFGVGTLLRSTAATVTVSLTVLLLLPGILGFINIDWVQTFVRYLPMPASQAFLPSGDPNQGIGTALSATVGVLVIAAYALVPFVAAAVMVRRRDA
jgi:ABC-2 type transport system permease protein